GGRPEGLNVAGWLTNGGSIAPRSSSQRTPPLRVSRSLADQVSPNQIAQVGRGMSIVQSPKFWSKRCTEASSPDRSHFVGSSQAAAGDRRARSAGEVLKMNSPRESRCHWPVSCQRRNSPPSFMSCFDLWAVRSYLSVNVF